MAGNNSNYVERSDGWHKSPKSTSKGNADYFKIPPPPVRDGATGHPIGEDGKIDWDAVIRKVNNGG